MKDVRPLGDGKWQVTSEDKITSKKIVDIYDVVMICNGHYNETRVVEIPGRENFKGKQLHSRYYRCSEPYKGQNVLVMGAGPSGMDLALQLSVVADKVSSIFALLCFCMDLTFNFTHFSLELFRDT